MKTKVKYAGVIIIGLIFGLLFTQSICSAVMSVTGNPIDENACLESLINQARKNPLAMAALIGKDPEQVIKDFPDKEFILSYGLPPVYHNIKLQTSANLHGSDMIENQYFAYRSIDDRRPIDRMQAQGYQVLYSGETLAMIGFYNLINPEDAVWAVFKKMFAEELDPARKDPWVILNPSLSEVGVSVGKGVFSISGQSFNAYIGVCDFGSSGSDIYAAERMLWHSINSARGNPDDALTVAGMNLQDAVAFIGKENAWKLIIGLPPLAWNLNLHDISRMSQYEWSGSFAATDGNDNDFNVQNRTDFSDISDYQVTDATEIRLSFYDDNPDLSPVQAAARLFALLLKKELSGSMPAIYNESFTEIGISVDYTPVNGRQGFRWSAVIEFACPVIEQQYVIGGLKIALSENQENTALSAKKNIGRQVTLREINSIEEIEDDTAIVRSPSQIAYSGPLGGYQLEFDESTPYQLQVLTKGDKIIYKQMFKSSHNRNQVLDICIQHNEM